MFEIGASLREARARQGAGFDEMEQRTKIRAKYLRFLEDERFDQLPGSTYTKGFLRVYANALGLDGQLYVDEFNSRFVIGEDEHAPRPRRVQPVKQRRQQQRRESRVLVGVVASIVVITALVIAAWRFGGAETPSVRGLDGAAPGVVSTTSQRITLEVRAAKGASYVEVWRSPEKHSEDQLYAGTLERGQSQRFVGARLVVSVRTPKHVVLKINGNRYPERGKPVPRELNISAATAVSG